MSDEAETDLALRPWRDFAPGPAIASVPSMLSPEELGLLYWLARHYWSDVGRIVDAGCFLGGSTIALATGLRDRDDSARPQPIIVYDRFVVEQYAVDGGFFADEPELQAGHDFRPVFDRNLAAFDDLLDVRPGDISKQVWNGQPIEILFLDVLKSWQLNDAIVREFWPSLVPERAIVVQQDYQYGGYPWLAITMEQFADCFERVDELPWATVAFRLRTALPDLSRATLSRDLPAGEKLALMDRALRRETTTNGEAMLRLSRALLLHYVGRPRRARAEVAAVQSEHITDPSVLQAAQTLMSTLRHWSSYREILRHAPALRFLRALAG